MGYHPPSVFGLLSKVGICKRLDLLCSSCDGSSILPSRTFDSRQERMSTFLEIKAEPHGTQLKVKSPQEFPITWPLTVPWCPGHHSGCRPDRVLQWSGWCTWHRPRPRRKANQLTNAKRYKYTYAVYVYTRHLLCVLHGFLGPTMSWPPQTVFVSLHACILQSWTCWKTKETCMRRLTFIQSHVHFICPLTSPHPRSPTRPWSPRHQSGSAANGVPWPSGWCTRHQLRPSGSAANPTGFK